MHILPITSHLQVLRDVKIHLVFINHQRESVDKSLTDLLRVAGVIGESTRVLLTQNGNCTSNAACDDEDE